MGFLLHSCHKDKQLDDLDLSPFSKRFLPQTDSLEFITSNGLSFDLTGFNYSHFYENIATGSDGYGFGIETYYAQHEREFKSFGGIDLAIEYKLGVAPAFLMVEDELLIKISSVKHKIDICFTLTRGHGVAEKWDQTEKANEVLLNNKSFTNLHVFEKNGNKFYFQADKGLVGFNIGTVIWHI